jgi:ParB family chromosome partitioning protein
MSDGRPTREHRELPLSSLIPPSVDLRDGRSEDDLAEITASLQRLGILQPIIVFPVGDRYEIIDGFTRYLCAGRAGLAVVPCYIYTDRPSAAAGIKYETAVQRIELTPAEEANFFHELFLGECGEDIDAVAARVGKTRGYVDSRIALLLGDRAVFQAVRDNTIKLGVAALLNQITDDDWRAFYLSHAIKGGVTVGVMTGWLTEWKNMKAVQSPVEQPPAPSPAIVHTSDYDPRRCAICRKVDPRFIPEQVSVHTHCKLAVLEPLLESYHGESSAS